TSSLEAELVGALAARSPTVLATVPAGDTQTLSLLGGALGADIEHSTARSLASSLERLQGYLFEERRVPRGELGADVVVLSAPGESRECVEIARALRDEADRGTP